MGQLKSLLAEIGVGQRAAARATGLPVTTINRLCNGQTTPRHWKANREKLAAWLQERGVAADRVEAALAEAAASPAAPQPSPETPTEATEQRTEQGDEDMIMRKQVLSMPARRHFKLLRDPFDDPQSPEDVYLSPENRFVREAMYDAALNGNFLAVAGESGSGKSTLREDLVERLRRDAENVTIIEPYILSMSGGHDGKPLQARHISEAIFSTLAPDMRIPRSQETRDRKLHQLLRDSNGAGMRHVLVIEEAHDLHTHTLKSLKRFWELKDGMKRLLSIILIGQPELLEKLGSNRAEVREVVQRCMTIHLEPIKQPADFLAHRFRRAGADLGDAFEPEALEALRDRLIVARDMSGKGAYKGYPLAISNFAIAAMNAAADLGERLVTADVVRQVRA